MYAVVTYVLGLVGVFLMAYVIDFLAGTFNGQKNLDNAMKVAAYAPTAAWVAGVLNIIPALSVLGILGLYSVYLLHWDRRADETAGRQDNHLYDRGHRLPVRGLPRRLQHYRRAVRHRHDEPNVIRAAPSSI